MRVYLSLSELFFVKSNGKGFHGPVAIPGHKAYDFALGSSLPETDAPTGKCISGECVRLHSNAPVTLRGSLQRACLRYQGQLENRKSQYCGGHSSITESKEVAWWQFLHARSRKIQNGF